MAKSTPKDFFFYILMVSSLYVSIVSVIALLFQYVNYNFPDPIAADSAGFDYRFAYQNIADTVRRASASLIVVWPVFLYVSHLISKDLKANQEKKDMKIRKWLLYLTLFLAAVTIIADLVTLIYNFFGGELSTRFYLKVSVVLIVALITFFYFFWDLRGASDSEESGPFTKKFFAWLSSVAVLSCVIAGFFIIGSPAKQRDLKFDEKRISDLQIIQSRILEYWRSKEVLPKDLAILTDSISGFEAPRDPKTDEPYEYRILQEGKKTIGPAKTVQWVINPKFELCAIFSRPSIKFEAGQSGVRPLAQKFYPPFSEPYYPYFGNWEHQSGRNCFEREIDPSVYIPYSAEKPARID